jgi:hypothetical protein
MHDQGIFPFSSFEFQTSSALTISCLFHINIPFEF